MKKVFLIMVLCLVVSVVAVHTPYGRGGHGAGGGHGGGGGGHGGGGFSGGMQGWVYGGSFGASSGGSFGGFSSGSYGRSYGGVTRSGFSRGNAYIVDTIQQEGLFAVDRTEGDSLAIRLLV